MLEILSGVEEYGIERNQKPHIKFDSFSVGEVFDKVGMGGPLIELLSVEGLSVVVGELARDFDHFANDINHITVVVGVDRKLPPDVNFRHSQIEDCHDLMYGFSDRFDLCHRKIALHLSHNALEF